MTQSERQRPVMRTPSAFHPWKEMQVAKRIQPTATQ
jgi:hypothetical protein